MSAACCPSPRARTTAGPTYRLGAVTAVLFLAVAGASWGVGSGPPPALASVVHGVGFEASVLGWRSWYGNYDLGPIGVGWCIDHGSKAPDAAYGYVPVEVAASDDTKAALSWAVTTNAFPDAVTSAAVMLVAHDLMGAQYPWGRLNVDGLTTAHLSGFGGREQAVIDRARAVKAAGLAHAHLRAPFHLTLEPQQVDPGDSGRLFVRITDAHGAGVAGAPFWLSAWGATLVHVPQETDATGYAVVDFVAAADNRFGALASVPDSQLSAFGPTTTTAQRIAKPHALQLTAEAGFRSVPSTTTSSSSTTTSSPSTSTTSSTSTTTSSTTTSTTSIPPPTTAPPTTVTPPTTARPPETRVPPTTPPATTTPTTDLTPPTETTETTATTETTETTSTTVAAPPAAPEQPPMQTITSHGTLPVTGLRSVPAFFGAIGLVLLGASLVGFSRHRAYQRDLDGLPPPGGGERHTTTY